MIAITLITLHLSLTRWGAVDHFHWSSSVPDMQRILMWIWEIMGMIWERDTVQIAVHRRMAVICIRGDAIGGSVVQLLALIIYSLVTRMSILTVLA